MKAHTKLPYRTVQRKRLYTQASIYMLRYIALHGPVSLYKAIKKTSAKFGINFEAYRAYVLRNLNVLAEELILEVSRKNRKIIVDIGPRGIYLLSSLDRCWIALFTVFVRKGVIPDDFPEFLLENVKKGLKREYEEYCLNDKPSEFELTSFKREILDTILPRIRTYNDVFLFLKRLIIDILDLSDPSRLEKSIRKLKPYTRAFLYKLTIEYIDDLKRGIETFKRAKEEAELLLKLCS